MIVVYIFWCQTIKTTQYLRFICVMIFWVPLKKYTEKICKKSLTKMKPNFLDTSSIHKKCRYIYIDNLFKLLNQWYLKSFMRKTAYQLLKNAQKNMIFGNKKTRQRPKIMFFNKKFQKRSMKWYLGACLPHSWWCQWPSGA